MEISRKNYEEFFLLYVDNELPAAQRLEVEQFVEANPDLKEELELLSETVVVADVNIVFEGKEELYKEEVHKVVTIFWWRIAAAAVLILALGTFGWLYLGNRTEEKPVPVAAVQQNNEKAEQDASIPEPPIAKPATQAVQETAPLQKEVSVKAPTPKTARETTKQIPKAPSLLVEQEVAKVEEDPLPIDVAVTPQKLDDEINNVAMTASLQGSPVQHQSQAKPEYVQIADDNIYFANTAVSKRNKFRGVFRKATRILDKVTSFQ